MATAGAKISIPIKTNYETTGGQFISSGYYSQWNVELTDMPQHGFSTFSNTFKGNYSLKPAYMAVAEVGGLFKLAEKLDLYAGAYFNYGLNNVLTPDNKLIYQPDGVYNGVLASSQISKLNPVSVGLKIGLYWYLKKAIPAEIAPEIGYKRTVEQHVQPADTFVRVNQDTLVAIKTTDTVVVEKPSEPVKPKIEIINKPIVPVVQPRDTTVQEEDPFEKAKRIAASIRVNFVTESDKIGSSENEKVKALSDILKTHSDICINIYGHTDNTGSHEVNLKYGMKRALTMKQKFLKQEVPASQMTTRSFSYDVPLVPNTSEENMAKNRRAEITVYLKKK